MKYLLVFLPVMALSQIPASEITRNKVIVDSVIKTGLNASINYHSEADDTIKPHDWELTITETIPSEQFLADNFRAIRFCKACGRKEAVHDTTWSERIRK